MAKFILFNFIILLIFNNLKYNLINGAPLDSATEESIRNQTTIIPKCCPIGEASLNPGEPCSASDLPFKIPFATEGPNVVDIMIGYSCKYGRYPLMPELVSEDEFYLQADGKLKVPFKEKEPISIKDYCLENLLINDVAEVRPFLCFPKPEKTPQSTWRKVSYVLFPIGSLLSLPCLIIISLLYFGLTELRTTQGKVLATYCLCLAMAFFSLSAVQIFGEQLPHTLCVIMAFLIQFSFMACFFWLNLLCLHTWRQLNKGYSMRGDNSLSEKMLYTIYSIYGWGTPIIFLSVSLIMDLSPTIPSYYLKPNFGLNSCWFNSDNAALPYFYGPIAILLFLNFIFFVMAVRIVLKTESTDMHNRITSFDQVVTSVIIRKRKASFFQALLLFLAMGLNWTLEVASWAVGGPPILWLFTDIINTLQGIIMFYIFVIRDKWVLRLFKLYFYKIFCCHKNSHSIRQVRKENSINRNNSSTTNKKTFAQMIPLVTMTNSGQRKDIG